MRGLTLVVAEAAPARCRAALTLASAHAALGGDARVYFHEAAVALLLPSSDAGDDSLEAAGLPGRSQLLAVAHESGVGLIACQTGLALTGIAFDQLPPGTEAGGMVALLAGLGDGRLVFV